MDRHITRLVDRPQVAGAVVTAAMEPLPGTSPPEPTPIVTSLPVSASPVPELTQWPIKRSITVTVIIAVLLVGVLVTAALWYAHFPALKRDGVVTAGTLFDLLKLVFAVVAGVGGVAALVVAYRRQRVAEHANKLAEFANRLAHAADERAEISKALAQVADERAKLESDRNGMRLFNERFAKASEQLGSDKAAIRLAGVYAMAGLADDWERGRQTCIDVLCAYLRMQYTPPPNVDAPTSDEPGPLPGRDPCEERQVRHTVIRVIVAHLQGGKSGDWRGYDFDLSGAVLDDSLFAKAQFTGGVVDFRRARFTGDCVSFCDAKFAGAAVYFEEANFNGRLVNFSRAEFSGSVVSFYGAKFADGLVAFNGTRLTAGTVTFTRAEFAGGTVTFSSAEFAGSMVSFRDARFTGGRVDISHPADYAHPPIFPEWGPGGPPVGLALPTSASKA